jgi:hypothetical protein
VIVDLEALHMPRYRRGLPFDTDGVRGGDADARAVWRARRNK